ncbi:MAG: glycosyltransferase [Pseudomonadota bacterium]
MARPEVSIVIPVYNESAVLGQLFKRLYPVLDQLGRSCEVVFVNDGSQDNSAALLKEQYLSRSDITRVVLFNANYGQHMAIMAGFEQAKGEIIITLDADLQNPPEELPKLLAKMDEGHDYVGTIRESRQDTWWRHWASRSMNWLRERITGIHMTDQGCMLRAYRREIIQAIVACHEVTTFIPALAYTFSHRPAEVVVRHEIRAAGESKYSLYKLMRLNFDLITGFSLVPLQLMSMAGIFLALGSALFFAFLVGRRLLLGPEAEGMFTLFALNFFLMGILLFGVGVLGEYIGRIHLQVRGRPRFIIQAMLEPNYDSVTKLSTSDRQEFTL